MTPTRKKIIKYKFEDSKKLIHATIAVNLVLGVIVMFSIFEKNMTNSRAAICLLTSLGLFLVGKITQWKSRDANMMTLLLYLGLVAIELVVIGLPEPLVEFNEYYLTSAYMGKIVIWAWPFIYIGLRVLFAFPLILIIRSSGEYEKLYHRKAADRR